VSLVTLANGLGYAGLWTMVLGTGWFLWRRRAPTSGQRSRDVEDFCLQHAHKLPMALFFVMVGAFMTYDAIDRLLSWFVP
jgi:hypothetical protein